MYTHGQIVDTELTNQSAHFAFSYVINCNKETFLT